MKRKTVDVSVVIPVYNSADWLESLVFEIKTALEQTCDSFEVVLVNDASPDEHVWPVIAKICGQCVDATGIDLAYNVGQARATLCGISQATGNLIVTMDDDFQHTPTALVDLIAAMRKGHEDCLFAVFEQVRQNWWRRLGSRFVDYLSTALHPRPKGIRTSSFRIMRRRLAETMLLYRSAKPQISPIILGITRNVGNIQVKHESRLKGRSNYHIKDLVSQTIDLVINASTLPLEIVGGLGIVSSLGAFSLGLYYLVNGLLGKVTVPGYLSTILVVVFCSGILLFSVAVLGKYITRLVKELTGLPPYVIKDSLGMKG